MDHPLQPLLLQIVVILVAARVCGWVLRRVGQPQVIGEMVAGILLGPTVLGRVEGGTWMKAIFTEGTRGHLELLSQLGVILFMFLIGAEFDLGKVMRQGKVVVKVATASMMVPFVLGSGLAWVMLRAGYGPGKEGNAWGFALFTATALAITAFPVLARILAETGLTRSRMGMIAIGAAALNDMAGWCLLAIVFAISKTGGSGLGWETGSTLVLAAVYVALMLLVVRPVLAWMMGGLEKRGRITAEWMAVLFILLPLSSWVTDRIGIHALFGAFMLGAVMPSGRGLAEDLSMRMEELVSLFLLPLFFAFTGLHTDMGMLASSGALLMAGVVTVVACVGKVGGVFVAARGAFSAREALGLGVLMNTRGLMELIVLNLALEAHAISAEVFSMMVLMTLVTTIATTPLVRRFSSAENVIELGAA